MSKRSKCLAVFSLALLPLTAWAELPVERALPLSIANELSLAGVEACQAKGYAVTVAVVDRAGQLKALARADKAGPHTLDSARQKAYTSASMKRSTAAILEAIQKNPGSQFLYLINGVTPLAGGLPVMGGGEVVGGIGIGGAPAGSIDEECAQAALEKLAEKLK